MASEEQLAILRRRVKVWNAWRQENPGVAIDLGFANLREANLSVADLSVANLSGANLSGADLGFANLSGADLSDADLRGADLRGADLSGANLSDTDLREADLSRTELSGANLSDTDLRGADFSEVYLSGANLSGANLSGAELSGANLSETDLSGANLSETDLSGANLSDADLSSTDLSSTDLSSTDLSRANLREADLSGADLGEVYLIGANLSGANLSGADLIGANLSGANLSGANLAQTQVLWADFSGTTLTGACIADWHISSSTKLADVKCDYIFRTLDENWQFSGRLPVDPDSTFAPGEFTQRFQILASAQETIDITFTEGIDWQAFFQSFQDLRANHPDQDISIQGLERKGSAFVVRLEVEADADKGAIETEVKQRYADQLAALEAQYTERLRLQGAHLEDIQEILKIERQERIRLSKVVETMANEQKAPNIQINHSNIGNVVDTAQSGSRVQAIQHNYAPPQNLSEAAKEIQALLTTLAATYNTTTEAGQEKLIAEFDTAVEQHPKWRIALKEGGIELIKVLFPPIGIPLEMARVYLEAQ